MNTGKIAAILIYAMFVAAWSMTLWGGWAKKIYLLNRNHPSSWAWIKKSGYAKSEADTLRFIKMQCWAGIVILTLALAIWLTLT